MALGEASRVLQQVFKQTGGLVWKNWPMNHTRRANAKKRALRVAKTEALLRASAHLPEEIKEAPGKPSTSSSSPPSSA
eukprot:jgi/Mesen1/1355/ME000013S00847